MKLAVKALFLYLCLAWFQNLIALSISHSLHPDAMLVKALFLLKAVYTC